jgi:hypothetical protein
MSIARVYVELLHLVDVYRFVLVIVCAKNDVGEFAAVRSRFAYATIVKEKKTRQENRTRRK